MAGFSANVSGETQILARIQLVGTNVQNGSNQAIANAVQATYDGSQNDVAVDKGDLKASGTSETHDGGGSVTYSTDHAWFVELGTRKMSAQPFLYPNFLAACQQLQGDISGIQP